MSTLHLSFISMKRMEVVAMESLKGHPSLCRVSLIARSRLIVSYLIWNLWGFHASTNAYSCLLMDKGQCQKLRASCTAGEPPDVIAIDLIYLPAFNAAHQMEDITDLAHRLPFFSKLSRSHINLATYDGKLYGLPYRAAQQQSAQILSSPLRRACSVLVPAPARATSRPPPFRVHGGQLSRYTSWSR